MNHYHPKQIKLYVNEYLTNQNTTVTNRNTTDTIDSNVDNQYKKLRQQDENNEYLQFKKESNQWDRVISTTTLTPITSIKPLLSFNEASNWSIEQRDNHRNDLQQLNSMNRIDYDEIQPTLETNLNVMNTNHCILGYNKCNEIHDMKYVMKMDEIVKPSSLLVRNEQIPCYSSHLFSSTNTNLSSSSRSNCYLHSMQSYNVDPTIDNPTNDSPTIHQHSNSFQFIDDNGDDKAAVFPGTGISDIPCRVCGAKSSGFHYGAITYEDSSVNNQ
ncbi:putative nuclear receptor [Schistosoma japonicum]|uniref:Putative nuclear receptor n=1 Tax=Schistosoma japonicum TaxID=6182 RepID=A0A4Z2CKN2_SCHJA|nr:putative nuclear receptor [Schistosoma japonicum]